MPPKIEGFTLSTGDLSNSPVKPPAITIPKSRLVIWFTIRILPDEEALRDAWHHIVRTVKGQTGGSSGSYNMMPRISKSFFIRENSNREPNYKTRLWNGYGRRFHRAVAQIARR